MIKIYQVFNNKLMIQNINKNKIINFIKKIIMKKLKIIKIKLIKT